MLDAMLSAPLRLIRTRVSPSVRSVRTVSAAHSQIGRWAVIPIVAIVILLRLLGPFLHAHEGGNVGLKSGLHLHLGVAAADAPVTARAAGSPAEGPVSWFATMPIGEGEEVTLASEYRRDAALSPDTNRAAPELLPTLPAQGSDSTAVLALGPPLREGVGLAVGPLHHHPPPQAPPLA